MKFRITASRKIVRQLESKRQDGLRLGSMKLFKKASCLLSQNKVLNHNCGRFLGSRKA